MPDNVGYNKNSDWYVMEATVTCSALRRPSLWPRPLVQAAVPPSTFHDSSRELVDDLHFALVH